MSQVLLVLVVLLGFSVGVGLAIYLSRRAKPQADRNAEVTAAKPAPPVDLGATPEPAPVAKEAPPAPPEAATPTAHGLPDALKPTRSIFAALRERLGSGAVGEDDLDLLEATLLRADVGVATSTRIVEAAREAISTRGTTVEDLLAAAAQVVRSTLGDRDRSLSVEAPEGQVPVWLMVGVNGVGKTTTTGKLAAREAGSGRSVVLAAGDTFRAAAAEQLATWAERSGAELVRGSEGADPSATVFDAVARAKARGADLVIADTAGRLHTKVNLVEELKKVRRVADREPGHVAEVLLVLDATTGQNGLVQAAQFTEAVQVTGVVLTKLDGAAKGGIVVAIEDQLGIPVKLVGVGEGIADLRAFDPSEFTTELFAKGS